MADNSSDSSGSSVPGPSRSRRRYMPGSARSKTIELGTLSEIEEDLYQNRKDLIGGSTSTVTQDDSCIGSVRRPSAGSVRSLARHLSERNKAERAAKAEREKEETKCGMTTSSGMLSGPPPISLTSTSSSQRSALPSERPVRLPLAAQRRNSLSVSHGRRLSEMDGRQYAQEMTSNIQRSASERRDIRDPFTTKRSPSQADDKWTTHASMPDYQRHASRAASSISRHGTVIGAPPEVMGRLSRSSSLVGRMLVYDPRTMSLIDPRIQSDPRIDPRMSDLPVPVWIPPPGPLYIPVSTTSSNQLPYTSQKMYGREKKPPSICFEICCGGVAQLLWTIICIILMGLVSTLILALFYV